MQKICIPQPTINNPYIVDNYPYGFRLRTKIRYWVETTKYGQRFCSQTLNPKTLNWNKPKKSTYRQIILIGLNEKEHITYVGISLYSLEEAQKFKNKYWEYLSEYQKTELTNIIKMSEVYDKIEYKCVVQKYRNIETGEITESVPLFDMHKYEEVKEEDGIIKPVDRDKENQKQNELNRQINQAAVRNAAHETNLKEAINTFKRVK